MKSVTASVCLVLCFTLFTKNVVDQKFIDTYYMYNWKETVTLDEASFFSHCISTDSGWYRMDYFLASKKNTIQMIGLYEDKENKIPNGTFRWFYPSITPDKIGRYEHGKKEGLWIEWYSNGTLEDSSSFLNGNNCGTSLSWYRNGNIKDSLNLDKDGNGIYVAWFENGVPSEAGRYKNFNKTGKWAYYHKNGNLSSIETYDADSLKSFQYYDEDGVAVKDTFSDYTEAYFTGGEKAWNKYVTSYLHFPESVEIKNSDHIAVQIEATIDEDGNIIDAEVSIPFYPAFDNEALRFMKESPKWNPAVSHNRKVRETIHRVFTFGQSFSFD